MCDEFLIGLFFALLLKVFFFFFFKCISSCLPAVLLKKNLQLGLFMTVRRKCYKHTNICAHRHTPSRRAARWCANDPVLNRRGRGAFAACWMDSSRRLPQERFLFTASNQTQRAAVQIRQSRQNQTGKHVFSINVCDFKPIFFLSRLLWRAGALRPFLGSKFLSPSLRWTLLFNKRTEVFHSTARYTPFEEMRPALTKWFLAWEEKKNIIAFSRSRLKTTSHSWNVFWNGSNIYWEVLSPLSRS